MENLVDDVFCGRREIGRKTGKPLIDVDDALLGFSLSSTSARRAYGASIGPGIASIENGTVMDSARFRLVEWSDRELKATPVQEHMDELGRSTGGVRETLTTEQYPAEVCRPLNIDAERLAGRSKDRPYCRVETPGSRSGC